MPGGRSHHSIVSFYEIYEVDSQFQLVMEYVDGKNAHDWVAELDGPLPIASGATHRPALDAGARIRPYERLCASRREAVKSSGISAPCIGRE